MGIKIVDFTSADGTQWRLPNLPATIGLGALTQLIGMFGEAIGLVTGAKAPSMNAETGEILPSANGDFAKDILPRATALIAKNIAQPGTVDLVKLLVKDLHKDNAKVNFDLEFASNYKLLLGELIPFAMKVNFEDFFADARGALAKLASLRKAAEQQRATSTGKSGE